MSNTNLKALSIIGSEDGIVKLSTYNQFKKNLPKDLTEFIIPGGCHSYFWMYGLQKMMELQILLILNKLSLLQIKSLILLNN